MKPQAEKRTRITTPPQQQEPQDETPQDAIEDQAGEDFSAAADDDSSPGEDSQADESDETGDPTARPESEAGDSENSDDAAQDDDAEIVVSIGEEAPPPDEKQAAPEWVRELRKNQRELARENRELKARLQQQDAPERKAPLVVGTKPTLAESDYDGEKFEAALTAWYERKQQAEAQAQQQRASEEAAQQAWQDKLQSYATAKSALKVRDYDDAEETIKELFNVTQQGILLQGADNPALLVYALGKNPKKAAELAKITDPVRLAFALAKLEKDLKVTNRKAPPQPERTVNGNARVSGSVDSTLERLRAEAEKTGNYTKVVRYKAERKATAK